MKYGSWNIRGLNDPAKQSEVAALVCKYKLHLLAILETRVRKENCEKV